jgi:antirestriction protein ArdC
LIAKQRPGATRVAGFHKWMELRRHVKKGEKGIAILAPMVVKRAKDDKESGPQLIGFKPVYVFDIAQTDGEPLPTLQTQARGHVADWLEKLLAHVGAAGYEVVYDSGIAPALGMQCGDTITLLPSTYQAETFTTLAHEFAHALLHRGELRTTMSKAMMETEAEAVSFIVATALGVDCGDSSSNYIQLYDGNAETLLNSLQRVQTAASEILNAIES